MTEPRIRDLCIDDEARILRALKALFRDMDVRTTVNPAEAIRWASEFDVDVIVCDQRMPKMQGIEVLREIRKAHPRAMRILLTGYADLSAVLGSVNEGEVFRYINKPWDHNDLRQTVQLATKIARDTPVVLDKGIDDFSRDQARREVGILVIEDDPETQQRMREILQPHYQVRFASNPDRALQVLEQHETGVVISETAGQHGGHWPEAWQKVEHSSRFPEIQLRFPRHLVSRPARPAGDRPRPAFRAGHRTPPPRLTAQSVPRKGRTYCSDMSQGKKIQVSWLTSVT